MRRIVLGRVAMTKIWQKRAISRSTKIGLVLLSAFHTDCRVHAFEMCCWCRILGIAWNKKTTNSSIIKGLNIGKRISFRVSGKNSPSRQTHFEE